MKGFSSQHFKKAMVLGLRRIKTNQRRRVFDLECHNLVPLERGLGLHSQVTDLNSSVSWGDTSEIPTITFPEYESISSDSTFTFTFSVPLS